MEPRRPKIGLLLLTAEWFSQIGASQGSFSSLPGQLQEDARRITAALSGDCDLLQPGVLSRPAQVKQACAQFLQEPVDAVVINYLTWGEDHTLLEAVRCLGQIPLLLWAYVPDARLPNPLSMPELLRVSGPVGALQASGPLKRLGRKFAAAFGSDRDPRCLATIFAFARAAAVAHDLRQARIGVLPYRCDQMSGTYVDEFRLRHEIGPELHYISSFDYRQVCEEISAGEVQAYVAELKTQTLQSPDLTQAGLERAARLSLGLAEVAQRYNLDALAIEDVGEELHRMLGLRPCLSTPRLFQRAVVSMEAELGGASAMLILRGLSGQAVMYGEIFSADTSENCLLFGHAGMQDARLAEHPGEILIEPDGEYRESEPDSAWMSFRSRGGRVTLLSIFCDTERFKFIVTQGTAVAGARRLLGSPHAWIHLDTPLTAFFEKALHTGMTQHWAMVHADLTTELKALAAILGAEWVEI